MEHVFPALKINHFPVAVPDLLHFPGEMKKLGQKDLTQVMPVFNDWGSFKRLVRKIDSLDLPDSWKISILAVNDGSPRDVFLANGTFWGIRVGSEDKGILFHYDPP